MRSLGPRASNCTAQRVEIVSCCSGPPTYAKQLHFARNERSHCSGNVPQSHSLTSSPQVPGRSKNSTSRRPARIPRLLGEWICLSGFLGCTSLERRSHCKAWTIPLRSFGPQETARYAGPRWHLPSVFFLDVAMGVYPQFSSPNYVWRMETPFSMACARKRNPGVVTRLCLCASMQSIFRTWAQYLAYLAWCCREGLPREISRFGAGRKMKE